MDMPKRFLLLLLIIAALAAGVWVSLDKKVGLKYMSEKNNSSNGGLQIISPAFREGSAIPIQYTCKGQNISPPLNILNVPSSAQSLAFIMHDPDAPVGDYVHWTMWDIPKSTETIAANSVPTGAVQGLNSNNENKYMGPCPPSGTHRYMFEVYALDKSLSLKPETTRDQLKEAMEGHIVDQNTLTATFSDGE